MSKKPPVERPLPEEAFDRFVSAVDGPVNRAAERVLKSDLVLAPLAFMMTASFRTMKRMKEAQQKKAGGAK